MKMSLKVMASYLYVPLSLLPKFIYQIFTLFYFFHFDIFHILIYKIHLFIYTLLIINAIYICYIKDLQMTRTRTDRPTSRDASHLKIYYFPYFRGGGQRKYGNFHTFFFFFEPFPKSSTQTLQNNHFVFCNTT